MKRVVVLLAAIGAGAWCGVGAAQDKGTWRASSTTAVAITGDIAIGNERLMISLNPFTIAEIRSLTAAELQGVFGEENGVGGVGFLYRLSIPADRKFLRKNTLCGSEETQWMVTMGKGKALQVAFFSGAKPPVMTAAAVADSTDLCGTYSYTR